ncbi:uncharacterized protein LOC111245101 [Varroa destructor]|uniref:Uncharacterized protein n=1 Tax=Varroa destructor TaxID=109461 RepID=A0A7M7M4M5_VARDE|nr:uncharacterized protein LOC111245101 [Varroa destructor]XP_022648682.1 uncharacterized protein LOC111245101 [Varroa destructor]
MTRMPEQGSTVVLGEAEKRASSKAFALLSQIKYVLDMNNRTMEFVAEVEGQLEEYFRKIGEEVRRKQENIRAEFDNLTETKKKIERLIEMTDHELEEVRTRGVKLERFYIANLHTLNTFLAEELTKQEARVFILDGYHVVDEHENTMESS